VKTEIEPGDIHPYVTNATRIIYSSSNIGIEIDLKENDTLILWFEDRNALLGWVNRLTAAMELAKKALDDKDFDNPMITGPVHRVDEFEYPFLSLEGIFLTAQKIERDRWIEWCTDKAAASKGTDLEAFYEYVAATLRDNDSEV
jgi:hypothetical protein